MYLFIYLNKLTWYHKCHSERQQLVVGVLLLDAGCYSNHGLNWSEWRLDDTLALFSVTTVCHGVQALSLFKVLIWLPLIFFFLCSCSFSANSMPKQVEVRMHESHLEPIEARPQSKCAKIWSKLFKNLLLTLTVLGKSPHQEWLFLLHTTGI